MKNDEIECPNCGSEEVGVMCCHKCDSNFIPPNVEPVDLQIIALQAVADFYQMSTKAALFHYSRAVEICEVAARLATSRMAAEIERLKSKLGGNALYCDLARRVFSRIIEAPAVCDPPLDIELRVASIISERDAFKAQITAANQKIEELEAYKVNIHKQVTALRDELKSALAAKGNQP